MDEEPSVKEMNVVITIETSEKDIIPNGKSISADTKTIIETRMTLQAVAELIASVHPTSDV